MVDIMWREGTPSITQSVQRATNTDTRLHLFVGGIMEAQLPLGWKLLNIDSYDGLLNPNKHINAFVTQMNLFMNKNIIMCRVFLQH